MTRHRITVTQVIEIEQQDLQAAAIALPMVWTMIPDPDIRMAQTSDPEQAAFLIALEMRNQLLKLLPVTFVPMPECDVQVVPQPDK